MKFFDLGLAGTLAALSCACGTPQSPADSIALGPSRTCNDAGVWDGLECASPHVQPVGDAVEKPKPTAKKKRNAPAPPSAHEGASDCDPDDPLCVGDDPY